MSESRPRESSIDSLGELLKESGLNLYFNPFHDSVNAREFGKYVEALEQAQERIRELETKVGVVCIGAMEVEKENAALKAQVERDKWNHQSELEQVKHLANASDQRSR